jgi:hypothetical protein
MPRKQTTDEYAASVFSAEESRSLGYDGKPMPEDFSPLGYAFTERAEVYRVLKAGPKLVDVRPVDPATGKPAGILRRLRRYALRPATPAQARAMLGLPEPAALSLPDPDTLPEGTVFLIRWDAEAGQRAEVLAPPGEVVRFRVEGGFISVRVEDGYLRIDGTERDGYGYSDALSIKPWATNVCTIRLEERGRGEGNRVRDFSSGGRRRGTADRDPVVTESPGGPPRQGPGLEIDEESGYDGPPFPSA